MTATALAYRTTSLAPQLDFFDDELKTDFTGSGESVVAARPQLRLIEGGGYGTVVAATRPTTSIEVYRRRRFLALVATSMLVLAVAWAAGVSVLSFGGDVGVAAATDAPAVHVVLPGDSYAAIAADLGVANPVAAAEQLRAANGGSELVVGQRLVVDVANLTAG